MHVLITGANRGIGKGMADLYRTQGASVTGTHRAPPHDGMLRCDVTNPDSITQMSADYGATPLDLLVVNAGLLLDKDEPLTGYPPEMWAQTLATNVTGVFLTIQALLPQLRASRGKIAIIASQLGSQNIASGGRYAYCASKAAAINIGRNFAVDLKPDGIAVGIYHPGWVQSDMGGPNAAITVAESAEGLVQRFDALSLKTTGCFETWDGRTHPF